MERNNEEIYEIVKDAKEEEKTKWITCIFIAIIFTMLGFFSAFLLIKNNKNPLPSKINVKLQKPTIHKMYLPQGSKIVRVVKPKTLTIRMDKNKKIYLGRKVYHLSTFAQGFLNGPLQFDKNSEVYIRADENLDYKDVMFLLKTVKEAGFQKASLITL